MAAPLTLYSAWFCPYAQRAWLALLHRGVPFVRVESLSHPDGPAAPYTKLPALLAANPRGLVPTLVDGGGRVCGESLVVLELVSELQAPDADGAGAPELLPADPWARAKARGAAAWVDTALCSPYYQVLVPNERNAPGEWQEKRADAFQKLRTNLRKFSAELGDGGPYYLGAELSVVDFALAPWAWRFYVLEHYRGAEFALDRGDPELSAYWRWYDAVVALPAFQATLAVLADEGAKVHTGEQEWQAWREAAPRTAEEVYICHVRKYADGVAQSKVADAVRAGRTAHELAD